MVSGIIKNCALENEICYRCLGTGGAKGGNCPRRANGRCH